ncbi:hypothetical protein BCR33DRAFT_734057 [Rhizoclosmatium globosum]|uniref:Uncharacterized protein n=1 Tax=Rhizoclosmatium globosum TaxID=329046 RepID=A0A1Y2CUY2_9FUNG|nr:hypothetical protein BCR33DRAFT_734057 [Rhizoclosmatium globosum]|eukprot:ORY50870.1 hypothetical protein BCR33DRAFT_734057 [Rhizoclosmatium globosum]
MRKSTQVQDGQQRNGMTGLPLANWVKAGVLFDKQDDITAVKQLAMLCPQQHLPLKADRSTQCAVARTDPLTIGNVSTWVAKFEAWMVAGSHSSPNLINIDEMRVKLANNSSASKAIASTSVARPGKNCTLHSMGAELVPIALEACNLITPEMIKSAFERTGIYPWKKEIIIKNATINMANPSTFPPHLHPAATQICSKQGGGECEEARELDKVYSFKDLLQEQQEALEAADTKRKSKEDAKLNCKRAKTAKKAEVETLNAAKQCQAETENGRCSAM